MAMDTARFVKRARIKLGLTQAELGEKVGKERRTIMRYERGEDLPAAVHLAIKHLLSMSEQREQQRA
jgi:transcriptional regulator with XRE-family HTH domain